MLIRDARVLTLALPRGGRGPRRGHSLRELSILPRGSVRIDGSRIIEVADGWTEPRADEAVVEAEGRVLMPAFVDCHTHACWAGQRLDEFEMRLAGATYLQILKAGGGIMSTVRAVRAATEEQLAAGLVERLLRMARLGTGTVEVKSGYGLSPEMELVMLRAIRSASRETRQIVVPTFLGAHAIDPECPDFVERTINETLPAAVTEFPGIACDAFCEDGAWSLAETRRLFENARDMGCRLRVHTDQFNSLGMTRLAIEMGAATVDHLEAITASDMQHLARSETIAVLLPVSGFHLDDRYAPARDLIDCGAAVAIATNCNPGSAPSPSMAFAIGLASRKLRMTPAEAIVAATYNAACVLDLQDEVGSIETGKRADLQLLDLRDERELAYEIGGPPPALVVVGGEPVSPPTPGRPPLS
ncbi:MAG TPA: imidazolonepropionase [Phycisphaerales bacterium]|nr:imidazolonepropionase [Phycisphaerales bacterium]HMP36375.1 imidazolonepropionase [Phycisphaerales bacterium]